LHNSTYGDEPYHPHMTLAFRDLRKSDFSKAWSDFSTKDLRVDFKVDGVTLLRHSGKEWVPHHELRLG
jgi:2'-5' RNA ligase